MRIFSMPRWILIVLLLLLSVAAVYGQTPNAQVEDNWATLNLRSEPSVNAPIIVELPAGSPLIVLGRTADNRWYQVQTVDGQSGWVATSYVKLLVAQSSVPVVNAPASTTTSTTTTTTTTTDTSAPAPVASGDSNGRVIAIGLNLRTAPSLASAIVAELPQGTRLLIVGRSANGTWLQVQTTDGRSGWVAARFVEPDVALASIPVVGTSTTTTTTTDTGTSTSTGTTTVVLPSGQAPWFTLGATASNIFATGQTLGNRANVFSKVGDSMTVAEESFRPIGLGVYNLGGYSNLQGTINFFLAGSARTDNPFSNVSLAAGDGWNSQTILNPQFANTALCTAGETPLACEYRLNKPAVALIMIGTNDLNSVAAEQFAYNLRVIANISIDMGVIPVLSTIPPRHDFPGRAEAYNQLIIDVAQEKGLPLWDFYSAVSTLPNSGIADASYHLSSPPSGFLNAANFTENYLQYGYVLRNLTMLQTLDVLRANILQ
jgi:uncharacterized protein YgiM (DUF1202 family)